MGDNRQDTVNYYGYKSINEMITSECTPLLDMLLKLSSIASNFASAANNVKNVDISEGRQVKELLDLVFEVRRLSEKVEKVVEDRVDTHLDLIKSGVFEKIKSDNLNEAAIIEAVELGEIIKTTFDKDKK